MQWPSGIAREQAKRLIRGGGQAVVGFGADVLDMDLSRVGSLDLLGGTVKRSFYGNIHGTCDLSLTADIDYGNQLVHPWQTLRIGSLIGKFYLGVFSLTTPAEDFGEKPRRRRVQGYDRLYLLAREIGDTWVAPANAGVLDEVRRVITAAGLVGVLLDGSKQTVTLEEPIIWPLVRRVNPEADPFSLTKVQRETGTENATTYLRVANDLLFSVGYRGLYADPATGLLRSEPYVNPEDETPGYVFDFDDDRNTIVSPARTRIRETFKAPNHWTFVRQNMPGNPPREPVANDGLYVVDKTAEDARKLKWSTQIPLQVADQASLVAQGDNRVAKDRRVETRMRVSVAPFPVAGHGDVYQYRDVEMEADVKVLSRSHIIDLAGADVSMDWEVVA